MIAPTQQQGIRAALRTLANLEVVPTVSEPLRATSRRTVEAIVAVVKRDVAAYSESGNPDVLPQLERHVSAHVDTVVDLLGGNSRASLAFVAGHAERRASQKFPLDAELQAYQCMHRIIADWIRDAALVSANTQAQVNRVVAAATNFTIEYTGTTGTLMTSDYVRYTRVLAEAEGDQRSALLNALLDGYDESDRHAARLLRRAGLLQQRQSYCVVVAQSVNPEEMESIPRAQRMVDAVAGSLATTGLRVVSGIRENLATLVVSGTRRQSGWTPARSLIADRIYPQLRKVGPAALIGLSNDAPSTSHIPSAAREARIALDHASVSERVLPFSTIPFRRILVAKVRSDAQSLMPAWLDDFMTMDTRARGVLSKTLLAYADCDMNVLRTAKSLGVHPNTIYSRVQRVEDAIGLNAFSYHQLTEMLLVIECREFS